MLQGVLKKQDQMSEPGMGAGGMPGKQQFSTREEPELGPGQELASPEEQRQYEQFFDQARKVLYKTPGIRDRIKAAKEEADDPAEAIASLVVMAVMRTEAGIAQKGSSVSEEAVFNAGLALVKDLADFSAEIGVHEFSEKETNGIMSRAADMYRMLNQDRIDQGEAQQEMQALQQASDEGRLDEVLPGAGQLAQMAPEGEGAPADEGQDEEA